MMWSQQRNEKGSDKSVPMTRTITAISFYERLNNHLFFPVFKDKEATRCFEEVAKFQPYLLNTGS